MKSLAIGVGLLATVVATSAAAQSWQVVARSQARIYLIDVGGAPASSEVTSVQVASLDRGGPAGDYSYTTETYELRCGEKKWRTAGLTEFGPDGAQGETYPEADGAWETARSGSFPESIKEVACDGMRSQGAAFDSIKAYIDAGRP